MQRVVVDTNTTVSAFLWGGTPRQFFTVAIETGVILLSSNALVQELENTLRKPKLEKYITLSGKNPPEIVAEFCDS
ncbi:MAG: putative toxin-antitoxin system toxin component, PIN family [Anaerolineae bacterium]|nr:putative toxin-antitoxin system toxin component, PIN family [Anaerolineae bacterium]